MRNTRTVQPSVFQAPEVVHPIAAELERASEWLDQHPELLDMNQALRCWLHQLRSGGARVGRRRDRPPQRSDRLRRSAHTASVVGPCAAPRARSPGSGAGRLPATAIGRSLSRGGAAYR